METPRREALTQLGFKLKTLLAAPPCCLGIEIMFFFFLYSVLKPNYCSMQQSLPLHTRVFPLNMIVTCQPRAKMIVEVIPHFNSHLENGKWAACTQNFTFSTVQAQSSQMNIKLFCHQLLREHLRDCTMTCWRGWIEVYGARAERTQDGGTFKCLWNSPLGYELRFTFGIHRPNAEHEWPCKLAVAVRCTWVGSS